MQAAQQYVGEKEIEQMELHVYKGSETEESQLYEDQGDGHGHKQGYFLNKSFTVLPTETKYRITQHQQGRMKATYANYEMVFHGFDQLPKSIELDSEVYSGKVSSDIDNPEIFKILIPEGFKQITLRWVQ
jgi:alpha-glucosidase